MGSSEHVTQVTELRAWPGEIPVSHLYTLGLAGERFFRELMEKERFLGSRCGACHYIYLPPRLYCERCFARLEDWREVGPQGVLRAHTVVYRDMEGRALAEPVMVGLIQLDGADGLLVHRLGEVEASALRNGMAVVPLFAPRQERRGTLNDIRYFRPA